jgi:MFS family permease
MRSGNYRINLLILLAFSQALAFIDRVNLSVVVPHLIKKYHYTPGSAGLLMSIFNFAYLIAILFAGPLTDLIKPQRAYPLALTIWSAATALCGLSVKFVPLAICRVLVGIGEAPMIPSGSRVIRETFPETQRGSAVSIFFAGNKIGLGIGIPLAASIITIWGRPWVFYVTGLLGAVWLAWWLAIYRAPTGADLQEPTAAQEKISWLSLLKYRTTWGMMLGQAGYLYVFFVFATWLPGYFELQRKLPTMESGLLAMLPFVLGIACVLLGGWLNDRLIARGYSLTMVRKSFSVGGMLGATVFVIIGALAAGTTMAVLFLTLAMGSLSLSTASLNAISIDVAPANKVSSLVSLQNFGGNIGGALAPIVTGVLVGATGSFIAPLLVTAAIGLVFGCGGIGLIIKDLRRIGGDGADIVVTADDLTVTVQQTQA